VGIRRHIVKIDVNAVRVIIDGTPPCTLTGQWVTFYALLATRIRTHGAREYVTKGELHEFGRWQHKTPASVGKEVARHLRKLNTTGHQQIVEHDGKTKRGRLSVEPDQLSVVPHRDALQPWLDGRRAPASIPALGSLSTLVEATLALHSGQAEEAMELAWATVPETANDAAWRAVVAAKAAQRMERR